MKAGGDEGSTTDATGDNASSMMIINEPKSTLYVSNIDWKIKKPILKRALHALFGRHGKILEIVALRRNGLQGQAWIIFDDVASATGAYQAENGFMFFGRALRVAYAREKSDRVSKLDGTFVPKDRRLKRKQQQQQEKEKEMEEETKTAEGKEGETSAKRLKTGEDKSLDPSQQQTQESTTKTSKEGDDNNNDNNNNARQEDTSSSPQKQQSKQPPSNIIFAENLPEQCNEMMLAMLFRQYSGYKEVRMPRHGLAFIEFDDEPHATLAMRRLDGFHLTQTDTLKLQYGKK